MKDPLVRFSVAIGGELLQKFDRYREDHRYPNRSEAVRGLMRGALIEACSDIDAGVRRKAVEALAELGDERDTPLLLKALKDSDSSVRLEAIYALESRSALEPSSRLSEPLMEAMTADDAIVRQAAVRLFGRLEEPSTATPPS